MKKWVVSLFSVGLCVIGIVLYSNNQANQSTGAPPYGDSVTDVPLFDTLTPFSNWKRPDGPAKVALQVGHWKSAEFPDELERLRTNTGTNGGGRTEWEVNLAIAQETARLLKEKGISVEILPATVPPEYWADIFVAIHADGSVDKRANGFKIAGPWRDLTGRSETAVALIEQSYLEATSLRKDENISRNMRGYYAFAWWRYEHSIHPMTTGIIVETGFLTNSSDQKMLINTPEIPAQGIANGLIAYLERQDLL